MTTQTVAGAVSADQAKPTRTRYGIVVMLFIITAINYADRATLSIAGPVLSKQLGIDSVTMGYLFSAFGWSYVVAQLPGGWLLDRFGSKKVYAYSILLWSIFTLLQGSVSFIAATAGTAVVVLFSLRLLVGAAEAPSFPANGRIVAAWFPANERGTASAVFNSAQYFATVLFAPLMGWITHTYGWPAVFYVMGAIGIVAAVFWNRMIHDPKSHPSINQAELDYIAKGGALVNMDQTTPVSRGKPGADNKPKWGYIKQLLGNRMLLGVYIGQYCITTLTYFFLTWFPVYLVKIGRAHV
jgi:ACS family glucarate transporter-like MFS transporter